MGDIHDLEIGVLVENLTDDEIDARVLGGEVHFFLYQCEQFSGIAAGKADPVERLLLVLCLLLDLGGFFLVALGDCLFVLCVEVGKVLFAICGVSISDADGTVIKDADDDGAGGRGFGLCFCLDKVQREPDAPCHQGHQRYDEHDFCACVHLFSPFPGFFYLIPLVCPPAVTSREEGWLTYQPGNCIIAVDFKGKYMVSLSDLQARRSEILALAQRYGARNVRVFGSVARGEHTDESDIDFLVRLDDDRSLLDHIALVRELEDLLKCKVDVVSEEALHRLIRDRVLSEGVPL